MYHDVTLQGDEFVVNLVTFMNFQASPMLNFLVNVINPQELHASLTLIQDILHMYMYQNHG